MCTGGLIGYVSDFLNLPGTRNDRCIPVAIFNHMYEIFQRWTGAISGYPR